MSSRTRLLVAVPVTAALAVGVTWWSPFTSAPSSTPPAQVAAVRDAGGASGVAALRAHLRLQPRDDAAWAGLALAYVEQARAGGDTSAYPKAHEAVTTSLSLRPQANDAALAAAATLAAARHDFAYALDRADAALAVNPANPIALAARTDALTELGRYDEALVAARTADATRPGLSTFSRLSYQYELRGDDARAWTLLDRAAAELADPAAKVFVTVHLADLARRSGDLPTAAAALDDAAAVAPDQPAVLAGQARLLTAQGLLADAASTWGRLVELAPLPEYLVEYGELLEATGDLAGARAQYDVVDAAATLAAASGVGGDLEIALVQADHGDPVAALVAAQAEWDRRQSVHAADAMAWALHANGRSDEALMFAQRATALGTRDARFLAHRGLIEASLGLADARAHLDAALRVDPGASPWLMANVRTALAGLGES